MPRAEMPEVEMRRSVFDYFAAMEIPVVRGRAFTRDDHPIGAPTVVVNTALANRVFPTRTRLEARRVSVPAPPG